MIKSKCDKCKGKGYYDALVSAHGDEKETIMCDKCQGKKVVHYMTDEEEQKYHDDYW